MNFNIFHSSFEAELFGITVVQYGPKMMEFLQDLNRITRRRNEIRQTYDSLRQNNIEITDETPRYFAKRYLHAIEMALELTEMNLGEDVLEQMALEGWA
ncbi:unnamed protein product [marine sediment metagenome]|uniref:Uncharacterized protein n=1 Tax=marine sediment metagenome TaxID=412755 RepID=X1T1E5_9ZZZZ